MFIRDQQNSLRFHLPYKYFPPKIEYKEENICFRVIINNNNITICQTCIILSSDTEHITHGSVGFHEKSEILAV